MSERRMRRSLANAASAACAALLLSACASGSGMFVSGNDGGSSGFAEEEQFADDGVADGPSGEFEGQNPILAASGNSLLPLPAGLRTISNPLTPTGAASPQTALLAGLPGQAPLVSAALAGATANAAVNAPVATVAVGLGANTAVAARVGLPGAPPLASVSLGATGPASPSLTVAAAGLPLASVTGGAANLLGVNPTSVVGSQAPAATALAGALLTNLSDTVMAVAPGGQSSPLNTMTPRSTSLATAVSSLLRPGL